MPTAQAQRVGSPAPMALSSGWRSFPRALPGPRGVRACAGAELPRGLEGGATWGPGLCSQVGPLPRLLRLLCRLRAPGWLVTCRPSASHTPLPQPTHTRLLKPYFPNSVLRLFSGPTGEGAC